MNAENLPRSCCEMSSSCWREAKKGSMGGSLVSSSVPCLFFEKGEYDGKGLPFPLLQPREERGPPQRWTEEEEEVFFSVDLY